MGFSHGIAVANIADFKLDIPDFIKALSAHWPDAQITKAFEKDIDFAMSMKGQFEGFLGSTINQQQIGWWDTIETFAEFCVWFRGYTPAKYQLLAWTEDFYNHVVVAEGMSEPEIIQGLSRERCEFTLTPNDNFENFVDLFRTAFPREWPDAIYDDTTSQVHWYLRSQSGRIEIPTQSISFNDSDLDFAAEFVAWLRNRCQDKIHLTAKREAYGLQPLFLYMHVTAEMSSLDILEVFRATFSDTE